LIKEARAISIGEIIVVKVHSASHILYQHIETPCSIGTKGDDAEMSGNIVGPLTGKCMTLGGYRAIERKANPIYYSWRDGVGLPQATTLAIRAHLQPLLSHLGHPLHMMLPLLVQHFTQSPPFVLNPSKSTPNAGHIMPQSTAPPKLARFAL